MSYQSDAVRDAGWALQDCQVEEYPFGSGDPNRREDGTSVLRLIPGGSLGENQQAGNQLARWIQSVARRYNAAVDGRRRIDKTGNGVVYCVEFDSSFTSYLPEDQADQNICAQPYGVEFTLVNGALTGDPLTQTWDPWFDAQGGRKRDVLLHYQDANGQISYDDEPGSTEVRRDIPPKYCGNPSPGRKQYDAANQQWELVAGYVPAARADGTW